MIYNHKDQENEREKLFNEVWKEPMTTVAKRYGLSDNGLRKRCVKLQIPLPPVGYWAKLEAGKDVIKQPTLPPLKLKHLTTLTSDLEKILYIEYIDVENKILEELKSLDVMGLLTSESRQNFLSMCEQIQVPRKIEKYSPLIIEYQNETEYRKARDKEHQFRDILYQPFAPWANKEKIPYRNNKAVLSLSISEKQSNRAFRIMETIIKLVNELEGRVDVEKGETDNAHIKLFGHEFSFRMTEKMIKRRALLCNEQFENQISSFRPAYEKIPSGLFEIEIKEVFSFSNRDLSPKTVKFIETDVAPIEKQLGDLFITMLKMANALKIANLIYDREYEEKKKERQILLALEEEQRKKLSIIEEQNQRNQYLIQNIESQMENWNKSKKLLKYAEELEAYTLGMTDEDAKEHIQSYIKLVRQEAKRSDPISDIVNDMKGI